MPSSSAARSLKRTRPRSPSTPCGKPRRRRPAPSRSSVPRTTGAARLPETETASRASPVPRKRRVSAASTRRSALPARRDRERAVAHEVRRAVHGQVGALAAQVQPAELEPSVREPQRHRLARAHGEVGHQQLELGKRRLGPHLGRPRERTLDARLARGDEREPLRQLRPQRAQERIEAGRAQRERQIRLVGGASRTPSPRAPGRRGRSGSDRRRSRGRRPFR